LIHRAMKTFLTLLSSVGALSAAVDQCDPALMMQDDANAAKCVASMEAPAGTVSLNSLQPGAAPAKGMLSDLMDKLSSQTHFQALLGKDSWETKCTNFLSQEADMYKKPDAVVLGGALLKVPGVHSAITGMLGQVLAAIPTVDDDMVGNLAYDKFMKPYAADANIQSAYYRTAQKYPEMRQLQEDLMKKVESSRFNKHPRFAELKRDYMALGNTTATMPYAPAPKSSAFLQLFGM